MESDPHIVILAAGQGKRMCSSRPKVLHPVLFRPMIHYVLDLAASLPHQSLSVVVGFGGEEIERECRDWRGISFVRQMQQLGTGHAVRTVEERLLGRSGPVLVLCADVILLGAASLRRMLERHRREGAACTIGTATLSNPNGYGRILRRLDGSVADVREHADCSAGEKAVSEVNAGIYFFEAEDLFRSLRLVTNSNAQGEYYLTDVVKHLAGGGRLVIPYAFGDPGEIMGINDRHALWRVESALQERVNKEFMYRGVTLQDPRATWIDPRCRIQADVSIEAGCVLVNSFIEAGAMLESHCRVTDSTIGAGTLVRQGTCIEESVVGPECVLGPYAHLRPRTLLGQGVVLGNFVEVKKSVIGSGTKASHLSYIGDAEIGRDVNVGCGFITCNYDGGPVKQKTVVEDDVFIGSDCQTVAPVRLGKGSMLAAGTTATEDVPPDALALSRGRQVVKEGWAARYRAAKDGEKV